MCLLAKQHNVRENQRASLSIIRRNFVQGQEVLKLHVVKGRGQAQGQNPKIFDCREKLGQALEVLQGVIHLSLKMIGDFDAIGRA